MSESEKEREADSLSDCAKIFRSFSTALAHVRAVPKTRTHIQTHTRTVPVEIRPRSCICSPLWGLRNLPRLASTRLLRCGSFVRPENPLKSFMPEKSVNVTKAALRLQMHRCSAASLMPTRVSCAVPFDLIVQQGPMGPLHCGPPPPPPLVRVDELQNILLTYYHTLAGVHSAVPPDCSSVSLYLCVSESVYLCICRCRCLVCLLILVGICFDQVFVRIVI